MKKSELKERIRQLEDEIHFLKTPIIYQVNKIPEWLKDKKLETLEKNKVITDMLFSFLEHTK